MSETVTLTVDELKRLIGLQQEASRRANYKFYRFFPDCTDQCEDPNSLDKTKHAGLCRKLYVKHVDFMDNGIKFNERLFMAANRIGKTETAAFETTCHLTGLYPEWWKGKRFDRAISCWVAGETMETTRNIIQVALMGPYNQVPQRLWTGMLPAHLIRPHPTRRSGGIPDCIETVQVKHVSGAWSTMSFKSFDQGERGFQGTNQDVIWLDEQCPDTIYNECLMRILDTRGIVMVTFTPLQGLTPFIQHYLENSVMPDSDGVLSPANDSFWPSSHQN